MDAFAVDRHMAATLNQKQRLDPTAWMDS